MLEDQNRLRPQRIHQSTIQGSAGSIGFDSAVGEGFDPKVGFVRRTDIANVSLDSPIITRWKEGYWSSMEFAVNGYAVSNAGVDRYLESGTGLELSTRTRRGHGVYGGVYMSDERVERI